jgi:hypothetical protein
LVDLDKEFAHEFNCELTEFARSSRRTLSNKSVANRGEGQEEKGEEQRMECKDEDRWKLSRVSNLLWFLSLALPGL